MHKKLRRFSYHQLQVMQVFLNAAQRVVTLSELEKKTKLKGKSLGGIISSLSRTQVNGVSLIEPVGKDKETTGLRWMLNSQLIDIPRTKKQIIKLLQYFK